MAPSTISAFHQQHRSTSPTGLSLLPASNSSRIFESAEIRYHKKNNLEGSMPRKQEAMTGADDDDFDPRSQYRSHSHAQPASKKPGESASTSTKDGKTAKTVAMPVVDRTRAYHTATNAAKLEKGKNQLPDKRQVTTQEDPPRRGFAERIFGSSDKGKQKEVQVTKAMPKVDQSRAVDVSSGKEKGTEKDKGKGREKEMMPTKAMPKRDFSQAPSATKAVPKRDFSQPALSTKAMPKRDFSQPALSTKAMPKRDFMQPAQPDEIPPPTKDQGKIRPPTKDMPKVDRSQAAHPSKGVVRNFEPESSKSNTKSSQSSQPKVQVPPKLAEFCKRSRAPKLAQSRHTTTRDQEFAARQVEYEQLTPTEKQKQDEWASNELTQFGATCPMTFDWSRVEGGYLCKGGSHFVSDELLAEGKGGMMVLPVKHVHGPSANVNVMANLSSTLLQLQMSPLNGILGAGAMNSTARMVMNHAMSQATTHEYAGCFGPYYPDEEYGHLGVLRWAGEGRVPREVWYYIIPVRMILMAHSNDHSPEALLMDKLEAINDQKRYG